MTQLYPNECGRARTISFPTAVVCTFLCCASNCAAQTTYNVTNTNNSGSGSLRQAITDMNNAGLSPNAIRFQIAANSHINISGQLPSIQRSVIINSTSVAGITLDGGGDSGNGLTFAESTVQGSIVQFLTIQNFSGTGVVISAATNEAVTVQNCVVRNNTLGGISLTSNGHHAVFSSVIQFNCGFGVTVGAAVPGMQISASTIQGNQQGGVQLAGSGHVISGCFVDSNGMAESVGDNFGSVVFGGSVTSATNCQVHDCTLSRNTPFGAKLVAGAGNKLNRNETYRNTTKGFQALTNVPILSHFVVDSVHGKVIVSATISGPPNTQVTVEFFTRYNDGTITSDQGAVFCGDTLVQLNSSGQGSVLASFDRNQVF